MTNRSDDDIRSHVLDKISSVPSVRPGAVEVHVNSGVVTLSGRVSSYQELFDIEGRVGKVLGVLGLYTYIQSDGCMVRHQRRTNGERRCAVRDRRYLNDVVTG